ncbi:hypothetical protein S7711_10615 [Stachybotrys chartarum IBT 7711]|uniref:Uncharacterized protein n=1 Tax=Stachybotrys chartarum (strain CBS 109288 / IBT 7711) TaxID=1280523 RepID=A0A084AZ19_STACB|nr:hypothetical protein S7711_10615 [Stachybotrys chartarum IBT 7711]KFA54422.1 hypothetical protein S40293_10799 [Stachybotrys chartarum IBT 40293]
MDRYMPLPASRHHGPGDATFLGNPRRRAVRLTPQRNPLVLAPGSTARGQENTATLGRATASLTTQTAAVHATCVELQRNSVEVRWRRSARRERVMPDAALRLFAAHVRSMVNPDFLADEDASTMDLLIAMAVLTLVATVFAIKEIVSTPEWAREPCASPPRAPRSTGSAKV